MTSTKHRKKTASSRVLRVERRIVVVSWAAGELPRRDLSLFLQQRKQEFHRCISQLQCDVTRNKGVEEDRRDRVVA